MASLLSPLRAHVIRRLAVRSLSALTQDIPHAGSPPVVIPVVNSASSSSTQTLTTPPDASPATAASKHARSRLRPTKAAITLTPAAVARLHLLVSSGPAPQNLRIGVRNKGCAGIAYHLEYVDEPGRFDEVVEQDGVRVLVDSKALFSIIGSEMDWVEDRLSAKFAFKNPNVKDACGCGESFNV